MLQLCLFGLCSLSISYIYIYMIGNITYNVPISTFVSTLQDITDSLDLSRLLQSAEEQNECILTDKYYLFCVPVFHNLSCIMTI